MVTLILKDQIWRQLFLRHSTSCSVALMRHLRLKLLRHLPCWNGRLLCLGNWSIIIYQDLGCSMTFWDGWYNLCRVCDPILSLNTGYSQQFLQFFVQLLGCCFIFYAVNRVVHVSRLDYCFYCKWTTILMHVGEGNKLRFHR